MKTSHQRGCSNSAMLSPLPLRSTYPAAFANATIDKLDIRLCKQPKGTACGRQHIEPADAVRKTRALRDTSVPADHIYGTRNGNGSHCGKTFGTQAKSFWMLPTTHRLRTIHRHTFSAPSCSNSSQIRPRDSKHGSSSTDKQRLTTLQLLLDAAQEIFEKRGNEDEADAFYRISC